MSRRVYLATGREGLLRLHESGVLRASDAQVFVPPSDDEEDEYATMVAAAAQADAEHGAYVVVTADVDGDGDVRLRQVASIHLGEDLSWYAVQELPEVLAALV